MLSKVLKLGSRQSVARAPLTARSLSINTGSREFEYFENVEKREDGVAIVRLNGPG